VHAWCSALLNLLISEEISTPQSEQIGRAILGKEKLPSSEPQPTFRSKKNNMGSERYGLTHLFIVLQYKDIMN